MNFTYRVGHPFWKLAARNGATLKILVNVLHDKDAGVFVATSNDLPGLVVEANDLDTLAKECKGAIDDLLTEALHRPVPVQPITDLRLCPS